MFPAPRARHVAALSTPEDKIAEMAHQALIIHGREDAVIPWSRPCVFISC